MSKAEQPQADAGRRTVTSAHDSQRVWASGQRMLTAGLILIVTLVASEALAIATVMPLVERELGDVFLYGWVFSGFFLGNLLGVVGAGRAADRMAPAIPFAIGLLLFIAGLVAGGLAPSMLTLVAARVVQGLGAGALPAIAYVCIGRAYSAAARPRMFAMLSTAWVLPSAVGPGVSGFVGEHASWRMVFLGLLPFVIVVGVLAVVALSRLPAPIPTAGPSPLRAAMMLALGAGLLLSGLNAGLSIWFIPLVGLGGTLAVVAYRRLTPEGSMRAAPGGPSTIALVGLFAFAFFGAQSFVPLALTSVRGVSVSYAGAVITTVSMAWTAGSWIQERRIRRIGPRPIVRTGLGLLALGSAMMASVMTQAVPVWVAFGAWLIAGLGAGLTFGPLSTAMLAAAAKGKEGQTTAAFQMTEVLGIALGSGVGGAVVAFSTAAGWSTAVGVTIVFCTSLVFALSGAALTGRLPASVLGTSSAETYETSDSTETAVPPETPLATPVPLPPGGAEGPPQLTS